MRFIACLVLASVFACVPQRAGANGTAYAFVTPLLGDVFGISFGGKKLRARVADAERRADEAEAAAREARAQSQRDERAYETERAALERERADFRRARADYERERAEHAAAQRRITELSAQLRAAPTRPRPTAPVPRRRRVAVLPVPHAAARIAASAPRTTPGNRRTIAFVAPVKREPAAAKNRPWRPRRVTFLGWGDM